MIKFSCPSCRHSLSVSDSFAGMNKKCPRCKEAIQIPRTAAAQPADTLHPYSIAAIAAAEEEQPVEAAASALARLGIAAIAAAEEEQPVGVYRSSSTTLTKDRRPSSFVPTKEPWFYGFLEGYVKVCVWFAALFIGVAIFGPVVYALCSIIVSEDNAAWLIRALGMALVSAWLLVASVGIIFQCAIILLFVDIGRRLRMIAKDANR